MAKTVNLHGVPQIIFEGLEFQSYNNQGTKYSVTTLLMPPRIVQLERRHDHEITRDISERFFSFMGTAIHNHLTWKLKIRKDKNYMVERRLFDKFLGRKVSGQADIMEFTDECNSIYDLKVTSKWKVHFNRKKRPDGISPEWEQQLNLYAYLVYTDMGIVVDNLYIIVWYRDFDKKEVGPTFPRTFSELLPVPVWGPELQEKYMMERLQLHIDCETVPDNELPNCTPEDMWAQASKFPVHKVDEKGQAIGRAYRVFDTESEALNFLIKNQKTDKYKVFTRHGKRPRCEDWCSARPFCNQYREYRLNAPTPPPPE